MDPPPKPIPKYATRYTSKFKKDVRLLARQGKDIEALKTVVKMLAVGEELPKKYDDHQLRQNLKDFRECHIAPDWVLVYQKDEKELLLLLSRTGSHANLFNL
jgi:mRNA interferase YafQ